MAGYTRAVFALVCAVMAATFFPAGARAEIITIVMNQAKIIKLPKPADTIVIGNSEIADATVQDDDTIVLTGKGFGQTNLVVFDDDGEVIMDSQLAVARQMDNSVRVTARATSRRCTARHSAKDRSGPLPSRSPTA